MTTLTEGRHAGEFIMSEANGILSRENVTVLSGQNLKAGHVVGRVLHGTSATSAAFAGNTGNGAMGAITVGAGAQIGDYKLMIIEPGTNAGVFTVEDTLGVTIGRGTVGVAFSAGGLSFTLADGATDFVSGDGFTITVATGSLKVKEYNPAGTDGAEFPYGILLDAVDASAADAAGVAIVRQAEINKNTLTWFSGASTNQKNAALALLAAAGVIGR